MAKYLALETIQEAIRQLGAFHGFFGSTFLVMRRNEAPVGSTIHLSLDAENRAHLKAYFRLHPKSDYFFWPFKARRGDSAWKKPKYASTTLQAVNTQAFSQAILHRPNEPEWGWKKSYMALLASKLPKGRKLPIYHFATWFCRNVAWEESATASDVVARFVRDFRLLKEDLTLLFDSAELRTADAKIRFDSVPVRWTRIIEGFDAPPDVPAETGAILRHVSLSGVGPVRRLELAAAERLNVITGDNGLGKSFLLDVIWWCLTRQWPTFAAIPIEPVATPPRIQFSLSSRASAKPLTSEFDQKTVRWSDVRAKVSTGLAVYAQVDGSFSVWDPAIVPNPRTSDEDSRPSFSFSREQVLRGDGGVRMEGLLRDLVRWQTRPSDFPAFDTFEKILQRMKPPDLSKLGIGEPMRVPGWSMEVPTLVHPYGTVPIVFESAGIQRILLLAYLIVWAWESHRYLARKAGSKEERQMVLLLDEAEAHLHPRWQRVLLPALLGIATDLHQELSIQYFLATHSPLVLASAEPEWDVERDQLFKLEISASGQVDFETAPFEIRGTADSWLQSNAFDFQHPGSAPAEQALRRAKNLMDQAAPPKADIETASAELADHLSADDPFWLRWLVFAAANGVDL